MSTQPQKSATLSSIRPPAPQLSAVTPAPGRKRSPILLLGVGGLLLGGAALGVYVYLKKASLPAAPEHNEAKEKEAEESTKPKRFISKPFPLIVNLRDDNGLRHLKVNIGFEISSKVLKEQIDTNNLGPQYLDFLNDTLSNTPIVDLEMQVGRNKLKRLLKDGLNELLANAPEGEPGFVRDVFFAEFVIN